MEVSRDVLRDMKLLLEYDGCVMDCGCDTCRVYRRIIELLDQED